MDIGAIITFAGIYGAAIVAAAGTMFVLRIVKVI